MGPPPGTEGRGKGDDPRWKIDTLLVHGADIPDLNAGSVVPPIYQTSTFHYPAEHSEVRPPGRVHLYTRLENPTLSQAADLIRKAENAEMGRVYASGMGALSAAILGSLRSGDEVVALEDLYGNTLTLLRDEVSRFGISVRWVPSDRSDQVEDMVTDQTRLLVVETPTNPTLRVHDLRAWSRAARKVGAHLLVDNTFATPVNQRPGDLGAHLVMHSATKYLGGHSDLLAGALVGESRVLESLRVTSETLGATLDPLAGYLLVRGMRTLALRIRRHNENGRALREELEGHPKILAVHYPGSHSEAEERLCRTQMSGRGGMISLVLRGGSRQAHQLMSHLRLVHPASSLGGVESLASIPAETSHRQLSPEERKRRGIEDGMVRLSLGIEDPADLVEDFRNALRSMD